MLLLRGNLGPVTGYPAAGRPFHPVGPVSTNAVENLVVAHERCNLHKRDFLAEPAHVRRWRERMVREAGWLAHLAADTRWEHHPLETENVARAIYFRPPAGSRLWAHGTMFTPLERGAVLEVFR